MWRIKALWNKLEDLHHGIGLVINFFVALVVLAGFIWGVWWALAQEERALAQEKRAIAQDERTLAQEKKADERAIAQEKKADERALAQQEQINLEINRLVTEQDNDVNNIIIEMHDDIDRLVSEQEKRINQLEQSHKANIKELTEEYATIVSGEISDHNKEMKRLVERNGEMVLDETVRRIVASHENIERALDDTYKKALDEGSDVYIFMMSSVNYNFPSVTVFSTLSS